MTPTAYLKKAQAKMDFEQLVGPGMLLISVGLFIGCVYSIFHTRRWLARAVPTQGEVVSIRQEAFRDSDTNRITYCYYATVTFQSMDGQCITFESKAGRDAHVHFVGKRLAVLYTPNRPAGARIGEFVDIWRSSLVLGCVSVVSLIFGLVFTMI